jgi:uncharacterized membrane protein YedE/YeeE
LPWYLGGAALAFVPVLHWLLLDRNLAVSGRFTALVDRVRFGKEEEPEMSAEDLVAAMRAATLEAFGEEALAEMEAAAPPAPESSAPAPKIRPKQDAPTHILFLGGLILGGLIAGLFFGNFEITTGLHGDGLIKTAGGNSTLATAILFVGGIFVGFGTRMSGGCTSGHGLCGVSRFQSGSLAATAAFFGAGIIASFGLEMLW